MAPNAGHDLAGMHAAGVSVKRECTAVEAAVRSRVRTSPQTPGRIQQVEDLILDPNFFRCRFWSPNSDLLFGSSQGWGSREAGHLCWRIMSEVCGQHLQPAVKASSH